MPISLLVAVAENRVIGKGGDLPWHLSSDLQRFKRLTMGHTLVMGRKTWESIGRPLPGRKMVVVSRQADYRGEGVQVVQSLQEALDPVSWAGDQELFLVGGAEIYEQGLPMATRLYLTRVLAEVPGDTYFPEYREGDWRCLESESYRADAKNDFPYCFEVYERCGGKDDA